MHKYLIRVMGVPVLLQNSWRILGHETGEPGDAFDLGKYRE
jgi:hypothetical protein